MGEIVWDGRDGRGLATPAGVYYGRVTANGNLEGKVKILVAR
jgi:hypothetical protein